MVNLKNAVDALLCREAENGYGDKNKMTETWVHVCSYRVNGTYPLMTNLLHFIEILCERSREDPTF